jgi:toxin ParE1/3/4
VKRYRVIFAPEAEGQVLEIYRYIANAASPETAARFTDAIITHCQSLAEFPLRAVSRDDVRPGLRVANFKSAC